MKQITASSPAIATAKRRQKERERKPTPQEKAALARERGGCSQQPGCRCPGCREFRRRQSQEARHQAWRVFQIQMSDASRNLIERLQQADQWEAQ